MKRVIDLRNFIDNIENQLIKGRGKWIAEFNESFINYPLGNFVFPLVVRGQTRSKGFLLSRLFAYLSMPNYLVSCFVYPSEINSYLKKEKLEILLGEISKMMKKNNVKWSWLIIPKEGEFNQRIIKWVEKNDLSNIGIALVNINTKNILTNNSVIGRKIKTTLKF